MSFEFHVILRYDHFKTPFWMLNFDQFQNFQIVIIYFRRQRKWTYIDDVNKWILNVKESGNLSIFFLFVFLNGHPLNFRNGKRVYMNFCSSLSFDLWPFQLELVLHLSPYFHLVSSELLELFIGFGFEHVESEPSLNDRCLLHELF